MQNSLAHEKVELGVADAARTLKVSEPYIRYLTKIGRLPCTRDASNRRRIKRSDLRAFQRRRRRALQEQLRELA